MLTIGLNRAVTLIAEKKANPGKGRRFGADPGRSLGDHPDKGGPIVVKNGRYGPYVSHDGVNATLPGDKTPDNVTLEEAVALIDARIAAGGGGKKEESRAEKAPQARPPKRQRSAPRSQPRPKPRRRRQRSRSRGATMPRQAEDIHRAQIAAKPKAEAGKAAVRRRRKDAGEPTPRRGNARFASAQADTRPRIAG